ncbi:unnamed protein product [Rangifer tarandus platyrhynchus]|uniref:Uncharacterized protein n=1 Tax=Rangifer tarandus platyrhynchus TaxID=3082113 RepID=A0AC59YIF5_RANTA
MPRPQESAGERRGDLGREGRGDSPSCRRPTAQSPPLFGCLGCVPWAQTSRGPSLSGPRREGDVPPAADSCWGWGRGSIKQDNTLLPLCPAALALDNHGNGHSLSTHYMLGPELPLSQSYKLPSTPPADLMEHKFLGSDQQHLRFPAMSVCRDGATVLGNGVL